MPKVDYDGSLNIQFDNGRKIIGCSNSKFEEVQEMKFKVGQKVTVIESVSTEQQHYMDKTGEVVRPDCHGDPYVKFPDGKTLFFVKTRLELAKEETMTKSEAFKAMLDGAKVVSSLMTENKCYSYWNESKMRFIFRYNNGTEDELQGLAATNSWRLFVVPKTPPKFSIGATVVYRSNRLATVVSISECEPYEYTLANPSHPNSTFVKLENELKEAK